MRHPFEKYSVFTGESISHSSSKVISAPWPLSGEGWYDLELIFTHTITIGTGTTPVSDGLAKYVKGINVRFAGLNPISITGKGLALLNRVLFGVDPYSTTLAATTGTYYQILRIPLASPWLVRPEDTIFDTSGKNLFELEIASGAISDLFGTPGTCTDAVTLSATIRRTKGTLDPNAKPGFYPYIKDYAPINPSSQMYFDLDRNERLILFGMLLSTYVSATAGTAYSGTATDNVVAGIGFRDNVAPLISNVSWLDFVNDTQQFANGALAGVKAHLFAYDGSFMSGYKCAGKSQVRLDWNSVTGATPQADLITFGGILI